MHLIREDLLERLDDKVFYSILVEYLKKTDKILHARDFFEKERDDKFDWEKRNTYVNEFPVKDIKRDLFGFVKSYMKDLMKIPEVVNCTPDPSPYFGFSDYIYIDLKKPENPKLENFYNQNIDKYNHVKIRFSDHDEDESHKKSATKKSKVKVDWYQKTFLQAAAEMMFKIKGYIANMHKEEKEYLDDISTDANESLKLRIEEGVLLDERLEEIADSTYATDSVTDIANWILNKPKPYRILYDKKFDVWAIADAMKNTHKDMSIDLFDSDYLYGVSSKVDDYINFARNDGTFNSGYTDAEVYSDYGFDNYYLKGLFFVPKDMNYRDYEESGFYSYEIPITSGTIFVTSRDEFTSNGIFRDLYNKLDRQGAIKTSLEALWKQTKHDYSGKDFETILQYFRDEAEEWEYDEDEVEEFIDNFALVDLVK